MLAVALLALACREVLGAAGATAKALRVCNGLALPQNRRPLPRLELAFREAPTDPLTWLRFPLATTT